MQGWWSITWCSICILLFVNQKFLAFSIFNIFVGGSFYCRSGAPSRGSHWCHFSRRFTWDQTPLTHGKRKRKKEEKSKEKRKKEKCHALSWLKKDPINVHKWLKIERIDICVYSVGAFILFLACAELFWGCFTRKYSLQRNISPNKIHGYMCVGGVGLLHPVTLLRRESQWSANPIYPPPLHRGKRYISQTYTYCHLIKNQQTKYSN